MSRVLQGLTVLLTAAVMFLTSLHAGARESDAELLKVRETVPGPPQEQERACEGDEVTVVQDPGVRFSAFHFWDVPLAVWQAFIQYRIAYCDQIVFEIESVLTKSSDGRRSRSALCSLIF